MTKKQAVKSVLKNYADNATTHGISAISNSGSKTAKILWTILFLFLFSYMVFSVHQMIDSFFKYETVTHVSMKYKDKLAFPSITICRNNPVSKLYLPDKFVQMLESKVQKMKALKTIPSDFHGIMKNVSLLLRSVMDNNNKTVLKEPPMILKGYPDSCLFAGTRHCNITLDFKRTFMTSNYGRCYTFNSRDVGKYIQYGSGPLFGLSLILYVNQSDYVPLADNADGAGFTLYVHRPQTHPFFGIDGVLIAPGQLTSVALSKTETLLKRHPYKSNCSDGTGIYNLFPGRYSFLSCRLTCVFHKVYKVCGYTDHLIKGGFKNITIPKTTTNMLRCRDAIITAITLQSTECDCPNACFEDIFFQTVSSSKWPANADIQAFKYMLAPHISYDPNNVTDDFMRDNFAKVNVFFNKLAVQRVEEKEKTGVYDLMSNIGGQLGFWTGSSVFSLAEAIALVLGVISVMLNKSARQLTVVTGSIRKTLKKDSTAAVNNAIELNEETSRHI